MKVGDLFLEHPGTVWKVTAIKGNDVELQSTWGEYIVHSKAWVERWMDKA